MGEQLLTEIVVETLKMAASDDPYLMASFPLHEWEKTEKAEWIKQRARVQATYICTPNMQMGYDIIISAELDREDQIEFVLRWGA